MVLPVRDGGGRAQGGRRGRDGKHVDSGYLLKGRPVGFETGWCKVGKEAEKQGRKGKRKK